MLGGSLAQAFLLALDLHDPETGAHCRRVSRYALRVSEEMGAPARPCALGGLLHDVGKLAVAAGVLTKPEALTAEEWSTIKSHPAHGAWLIGGFRRLREALPSVRYHHERYDGYGYPSGLAGEDIPLAARVVCAVDALDVMTTGRPYQPARSWSAALEILDFNAGAQFDPQVVAACRRIGVAEWELLRETTAEIVPGTFSPGTGRPAAVQTALPAAP